MGRVSEEKEMQEKLNIGELRVWQWKNKRKMTSRDGAWMWAS